MEDTEINIDNEQPILLFGIPLRFNSTQLIFREFTRFATIMAGLVTLIGAVFLKVWPVEQWYETRFLVLLCSLLTLIQHGCIYANLLSNGWGNDKGKFWCDVKIMIVRGFNTIRTTLRLVITPLLFVIYAMELQVTEPLTILFCTMLAIISELQTGLSENQNQYDISTETKFVDTNNQLLLEPLHQFQKEHVLQRVTFTPLVTGAVIQFVLITSLGFFGQTKTPTAPIIIIIYLTLLLLMAGLYLRRKWTFVEYGIYRSIVDIIILLVLTVAIHFF